MRTFILLTVFFVLVSCQQKPLPRDAQVPEIVSSAHHDEGPQNRYNFAYEPVTYNQEILAPLPGLYYCFKMVDWNKDGLIDILGLARRGGGLRFIKNVGTKEKPLFRYLHKNEKLLESDPFNQWFDVLDYNNDGNWDIIGWHEHNGSKPRSLHIYLSAGNPEQPRWDTLIAAYPDGKQISFGGRVEVSDWDDDGTDDIIIARSNMAHIFKSTMNNDAVSTKRPPGYQGFKDTAVYNTHVGEFFFFKGLGTDAEDQPVFAYNQPIKVDGEPLLTYVGPYPSVYDIDNDGLKDLIYGTQKPGLHVLRNIGSEGNPILTESGLLVDIDGEEIYSSFAFRFEPADMNGDGVDDFVTAAYFGNQDRFLLYTQQNNETGTGGWKFDGFLSVETSANTPIYGAGNSSVDPVDWDGDGDMDLLLGSEPCMPTVFINEGNDRNRIYAAPQWLKFVDGEHLETHSLAEGDGSIWGPLEWYSDRLAPRARDWNNDGVLDIISSSMGKRLYFFKGEMVEGELRFHQNQNFQYKNDDFILPDRQFVDVLDYNQDGYMDVVCNTSEPAACVFYGDGTINLGEPVIFKHPDGSIIQPYDHWQRKTGKRTGFEITDWDLDGIRDMVVYQFHEGIFLYKGVNDTIFEREKRLITMYSHMAGCAVTDWDHNGIPDLLLGGDERRMIEVDRPAHVVVVYGEDTMHPPGKN